MSHGQEESVTARYPDISDHGLIGDLQTAALVTTDGTVDCSAVLASTRQHVRVLAWCRPRRLALISAAINLDHQLDHAARMTGPVLSRAR